MSSLSPPSHRDQTILGMAQQYPSLQVLLCTDAAVYFSGPASIWRMAPHNATPRRLATVPLPWVRHAARWRLLRRAGRLDLREMMQLPTGVLLTISQKQILALDPNSGALRRVFQVPEGGRPRGLAWAPSGHLFVGEYYGNPRRRPLRIWSSADDGETWELVHTLPGGRAKHIHNIIWDPYREGLWLLTGDSDRESALLFTSDEFKTVTEVRRGDQMARACKLFCKPEGLYYATDTERAPNWFLHLEVQTGRLHKIQPLPGSCMYAARMADRYWISTSVEPSKVNYDRKPALWFSSDLQQWTKLVEFEKDWWPGEYLGFGRIKLPRVQGTCQSLVFSTVAVKNFDLSTFIFQPKVLEHIFMTEGRKDA
jgi:hypothetical protein